MIKQRAANLQFFPGFTYPPPLLMKINRFLADKTLAGTQKRIAGEGISAARRPVESRVDKFSQKFLFA
jgi:hypothetical protein